MLATDLNEVVEKARRDQAERWDPIQGEAHELPETARCLRDEDVRRLLQVGDPEDAVLEVPLLHAHGSAAYDQPLHCLRVLRRQAVPHESAVAQPHHAHPLHLLQTPPTGQYYYFAIQILEIEL